MVIISQGQNPASRATPWGEVLGPSAAALGSKLRQNREAQENINQGSILKSVIEEIAQKGDQASFEDIVNAISGGQSRGLSPKTGQTLQEQYAGQIPKRNELAFKNRELESKQNAPQKLPKSTEEFVKATFNAEQNAKQALEASKQLREVFNRGNASSPGSLAPSILRNKEAQADVGKVETLLPQLIYFHKGMFPRGITQGEFLALSKKLPSTSMTKEQQIGALDSFDKLTELSVKKANAVRKALTENGGQIPPYLEAFIEDFYDQEAKPEFEKLLNTAGVTAQERKMGGEGGGIPGSPEVLGRSQGEKSFSTRNKKTGEVHHGIPNQYLEEASKDPEFEILESEGNRGSQSDFGENESEYEARQAEKRRLLRKKK